KVKLEAPPPTPAQQAQQQKDNLVYVLAGLLAYLRDTQSRAMAKQAVGTAFHIQADLVSALLEGLVPSRADSTRPSIDDFLALAQGGLSASYFAKQDLTGSSADRIDAQVDFAWAGSSPAQGLTPASLRARWAGTLRS